MVEGENYAGYPHLCHRNPDVYRAMFDYARMLIEELGFDGFPLRFRKRLRFMDDQRALEVSLCEERRGIHTLCRGRNYGRALRRSMHGSTA